jgi:hypothetical protein
MFCSDHLRILQNNYTLFSYIFFSWDKNRNWFETDSADIFPLWSQTLFWVHQLYVKGIKISITTIMKQDSFNESRLFFETGSLWCRQSQQSFNTSTPPLFSSSLYVSAPTGHLQVRYTTRYSQGLSLIQRIRCTYTTWLRDVICLISVLGPVVPNTCYQT